MVVRPLKRLFRPEVRGLDRYPDGPALVVGNHNGGTLTPDTFIFGDALVDRWGVDALPFGLAHELPMNLPVVGTGLSRLGAVRASHENAGRVFDTGSKVMVYPGGDIDALRPYRDRNRIRFDGRRGYLRLALRHGVPIVPVVAAGAHAGFVVLSDGRRLARALRLDRLFRLKALPISFSLPWGLTVGFLPPYYPLKTRILIEVLPPIHFARSGDVAASDDAFVRACDERVRTAMQAKLCELALEVETGEARERPERQAEPSSTGREAAE
jgi:1-acyl-sn-glycerol-3-phosphate acyltransferase